MYIKDIISIENYRNLSGITFSFDDEINFIVGENDIGKTNLIEMLGRLLCSGRFDENDFYDRGKPVRIVFRIGLRREEAVLFGIYTDIEQGEGRFLTIAACQEDTGSNIEYYNVSSGERIDLSCISRFNYLYYSAIKAEKRERLTIALKIDGQSLKDRLTEITSSLKTDMLTVCDGLQFTQNVCLRMIKLLAELKSEKSPDELERYLVTGSNGQKYLPLILALDEPEVHQHPYRQRALVKSLKRILDNKNERLGEIIRSLFGIDGFIGQIFVVTHSPNILLDDYRQIVRVYRGKGGAAAACGSLLEFDTDTRKHLISSFIYFKEAMFCNSIILVEGDTEFGAVPVFARRLNIDLDTEGVGVVKMDGADGVLKYMSLLKAFRIRALAILDRDKERSYAGYPDIYFTRYSDFEEEVFEEYSFRQFLKLLAAIKRHSFLKQYLGAAIKGFDGKAFADDPLKYDIPPSVDDSIMPYIKKAALTELRDGKNVINGAFLAEYADNVPESFRQIILKAVYVQDMK